MREEIQVRFSRRFVRAYGVFRATGKIAADDMAYTLEKIAEGWPLPDEWSDHELEDNWSGFREFHFMGEPDLLVIYRRIGAEVIFENIGRHRDFFLHRKWQRKGRGFPGRSR
jgi:mRNA interferase YafQ